MGLKKGESDEKNVGRSDRVMRILLAIVVIAL